MAEFYVGVLPEDRQKLLDFIEELKKDLNEVSKQISKS